MTDDKKVGTLLVNAFDERGGAAKAAQRLHRGLDRNGFESRMLVLNKSSYDSNVLQPVSYLDRLWFQAVGHLERRRVNSFSKRLHTTPWSINRYPSPISKYILVNNPDIIHLHWIHAGMLPIGLIPRLGRPIVWTLHDMWAMTGGCHYSSGCKKYQQSCGHCPLLGSSRDNDLSQKTFKHKQRCWNDQRFHIVAPSHWLAECARASNLLRDMPIQVIPNGLDLTIFRRHMREEARAVFDLPVDKKLILYGAEMGTTDPRKGFHHFQAVLEQLTGNGAEMELVIFGHYDPAQSDSYPLKTHQVGYIVDERLMALLYSAVDVLVAPATEDNLPNTVAEAIACGTPCVAFNIGGMPDLIEHHHNGYLAEPFEIGQFTEGVSWVLGNDEDWRRLSHNARKKAEDYLELAHVVDQYVDLYHRILDNAP